MNFSLEDAILFCGGSVDNLKAFVNDLLAGNIEAYIKSEDVPENNDGPVKVR